MALVFEWHREKAERNLRDHGVSFEEAKSVFLDRLSSTIGDPDHSDEEDRFITIGVSSRQRVLVVIHCDRRGAVRIITARRADRAERRDYEEGRR